MFGTIPAAPGGFGAGKAPVAAGGGFGGGFGTTTAAPGGFGAGKAPVAAGGGFGGGFGTTTAAPGGFGAGKAPVAAGGGFGGGFGMGGGVGGAAASAAPLPPPYSGVKGPGNQLEWVRHVDPSQLSDASLFESLPTSMQQHLVALRQFMEEEKNAVTQVRQYFQNVHPIPSTGLSSGNTGNNTNTMEKKENPSSSPLPKPGDLTTASPEEEKTTSTTSLNPIGGGVDAARTTSTAGGVGGTTASTPSTDASSSPNNGPGGGGGVGGSYALLTRLLSTLRGGPKSVDLLGVRCHHHEQEAYQLSAALDMFDQEIRLYERERWSPVKESWRQAAFAAGKKIGDEEAMGRGGNGGSTGNKRWTSSPAPPLSTVLFSEGRTVGEKDGGHGYDSSSASASHTLELSGFPFFQVVEELSAQMAEMGETLAKLELTLLPPGSSRVGVRVGNSRGPNSRTADRTREGRDGMNLLSEGAGLSSSSATYGTARRAAHAARATTGGGGMGVGLSTTTTTSRTPWTSLLPSPAGGAGPLGAMVTFDPELSLSERYHNLHGSLLHELELFTQLSQWAAQLQHRCETARELFARRFGEAEAAAVFREVPNTAWNVTGGTSGGGSLFSSLLASACVNSSSTGGSSNGMRRENRPARYLQIAGSPTAPSAPGMTATATAAAGGFGAKPPAPAAGGTTGGFGTTATATAPAGGFGGFGAKTQATADDQGNASKRTRG